MKPEKPYFIISRVDNLGDVVLTLPTATALKKQFPNAKIGFLARDYARPILNYCQQSIDEIISWDELEKLPLDEAVKTLKAKQATHIIHTSPHKKIAKIAHKAAIPNRIGIVGRTYHWLHCNQRMDFSRKKSSLHEAQLNFKLLKNLIPNTEFSLEEIIELNPLTIPKPNEIIQKYLYPKKFNLILHPLSNGNGREWPIEKFIALIHQLDPKKYHILITGSPKEGEILKEKLILHCPQANDLTGKLNLNELLHLINNSDGLVASGTGPLHIAAALGIHTLGLFPLAASISTTRWKPLGKKAQYLKASQPCTKRCFKEKSCDCMSTIHEETVKSMIDAWKPC